MAGSFSLRVHNYDAKKKCYNTKISSEMQHILLNYFMLLTYVMGIKFIGVRVNHPFISLSSHGKNAVYIGTDFRFVCACWYM